MVCEVGLISGKIFKVKVVVIIEEFGLEYVIEGEIEG